MEELSERRKHQGGFTLIELLIAIVVVGILTAVAIVGIGGLVNNGETAACKASLDAAKAATAVHYANQDGSYPATLNAMINATPKELEVPSDVTVAAGGLSMSHGTDWTMTMTAGSPPSFACTP